jgi:ribosomal peptide maturation radical SAM protein 1
MEHREPSMDIVLAVLPFAGLKHPSLALSLFKRTAVSLGLRTRVSYFNFKLAEWIGRDLYDALELGGNASGPVQRHSTEALIGEWFFSNLVFDDGLPPSPEYISKFVASDPGRAPFIDRLLSARESNGAYISRCVDEIRRYRPRLVGLTSTFDQTCACLAVARRLKQLPDPPTIVMGGANCEGEMGYELARCFPYLDYVCTGEGDNVFPALVRRLFHGVNEGPIEGLVTAGGPFTTPSLVRDLDTLPTPDYDDYFEAVSQSPLRAAVRPEVLFETSRGCWWGAVQHCTFCGLNGNTMAYRSKSSERLIQELSEVSTRYGVQRIQCVDNILDMKYFRTFFPRLIESGLDLDFFFDTKANLKLDHVRMLRQARVRSILPGLESLSNPILRLMRKGTTGAQNIQTLRWCSEFGIQVIWSFLYGFPNEPSDEYESMSRVIPLLAHLQPPSYCIPVQLDRFSPYFNQSAEMGVTNVRPIDAYTYIFPFTGEKLRKLAYFFDFDFQDGRDPLSYAQVLIDQVLRWSQEASAGPRLDLYQSDATLIVADSRACALRRFHVLDGFTAEVYLACDSVQTLTGLTRKLPATLDDIRMVLDDLIEQKLMIEIEGQYISLAVLRNRKEISATTPREENSGKSETLVQLQ